MNIPDNFFQSFCLVFINQDDFNQMIEIRGSFNIVDISWSERIINFDNEEKRQKMFDVATCSIYKVKPENIIFSE